MSANPQWLERARRLQALAQSGLHFTKDPFDKERYEEIRALAAEMMASRSDASEDFIRDLFAQQTGYATPKVDVRGAVFQDDKLLFVRERSDGRWTLPGGWADVNEPPSLAIEREILEESGYSTRAIKLCMVLDRALQGHEPPRPFHVYKLFFHCDILSHKKAENIETDVVAFFAKDALPELSLERVTPREIHRLFEHHRHPDLPTDFD